jgi:zinc protease
MPGLEALIVEARRMQQFGFTAEELDRARAALLASYERAFKERDTSENAGYAGEYVRAFLENEPIPGVEFEYRIATTFLPAVTVDEVTAEARKLIHDDNRVVLVVAPEKKEAPRRAKPRCEGHARQGGKAARSSLRRCAGRAGTGRKAARTRQGDRASHRGGSRGDGAHTVQWRRSLAQAHRLQERPGRDQRLCPGRRVARAAGRLPGGHARHVAGRVGGVGGLNPVDLSKLLAGKIASASPTISTYTHGDQRTASPRDLETAFQLNYLAFTAPNLTRDAFELLKRRLASALDNQARTPATCSTNASIR